jgi:SAM-dependent methyltransferase
LSTPPKPAAPLGDAVAERYARLPYPDPAIGATGRVVWNDPSVYAPLFWPCPARGAPGPAPELLVAGCGTGEAVALALANPAARVLGIDVSAPSLAHSAALAERHGVTNLALQRLPLEDIARLGRTFDWIGAAGVLHHLADPAAGLAALGAVLKPHGVVVGAVYGAESRTGLDLLQSVFADLQLGDGPEAAAAIRATLQSLPAHHPAQGWLRQAGEAFGPDAHVLDTFAHPREVRYAALEVPALVAAAGLAFHGWFARSAYHPDALYLPEHPLFLALDAVPEPEVWGACARLSAPPDHVFVACRADRDRATWVPPIDPDHPGFDALVPGRRFPPTVARPPLPYDPRQAIQAAIYDRIDGQTPLGPLLTAALPGAEPGFRRTYGAAFMRHLWRKDAVYFTWS